MEGIGRSLVGTEELPIINSHRPFEYIKKQLTKQIPQAFKETQICTVKAFPVNIFKDRNLDPSKKTYSSAGLIE